MRAKDIKYIIGSEFDNKGAKAANKSIKDMGKAFLKSTIGITSAAAAVYKINDLLKQSVNAALADQQAVANLNRVLQNNGFGAASNAVNDYINKLQFATGVSEDQLRPAFISLFSALGSVTQAQKSLNVAMDVSAATGKDLSQVTGAITKAASGSTVAISRLGLGIDKAKLATMSFDDILTVLTQKFGGASATAADTMKGKFDRMKIAVSEAKEEIGNGLLAALNTLATEGGANIDSINKKITDTGTAVGDFARGVAILIKRLDEMGQLKPTQHSIWEYLWKLVPILPSIAQYASMVTDVGANQRKQDMIGRGGSYFTYAAQQKAEADAKRRSAEEARRAKLKAAMDAAKQRRDAALKAKQKELDKAANELNKQFDIERIGLAAALAKVQDEATKSRLQALMNLNDLQYVQNDSLSAMDEILKKINDSLKKMGEQASAAASETDKLAKTSLQKAIQDAKDFAAALADVRRAADAASAAVASTMTARSNGGQGKDPFYTAPTSVAAALSNIGEAQAAAALTNMFPEADRASAGSGNFGSYGSSPTVVNVNVSGSLVAQADLEAALAGAVNSSARAGLSYAQVFSRL